jgi:hypothetical protein
MFNEGNQIHNLISSSGSGSDFLTSYGSGYGSTSQKVPVPTDPVPVPQHCVQHCGITHVPTITICQVVLNTIVMYTLYAQMSFLSVFRTLNIFS